ncbi:MAG: Ig-like domain-containing protein [Bacteroidota bacterium]
MKLKFHFTIVLFLLAGCAGQRPPEGGPADSVPPEIISVTPAPNTVNFTDNSIVIEFSEYVDRRSVEDAVFISPAIDEKEFDWSGTEVEIIFHQELRKNTTYVLTIGTDVTDVRARNRMAKAFALAFSTGSKIDNGIIAGKVIDEKPDGVMIFSYRLNSILADTLNPAISKPDHLTQTGKNGEFSLTNLAAGKYRLFAIRDEYRNLLYDAETDDVGTTDDITLTEKDTLAAGIAFTIAKEDTTPPRISSVTATDSRHLSVQFSEPMDSASIAGGVYRITDTLSQPLLNVLHSFPVNPQFSMITLVTEMQTKDSMYVLQVSGVKDKNGFLINSGARMKQFNGSGVKDTIPPKVLTSSFQDNGSKVLPDDEIVFQFNDVILRPVSDTAAVIRRVKDSSLVPFSIQIRSLNTLVIKPRKKLNIDDQYVLSFKWNGIKDIFGNYFKDSISTAGFGVDDPENYGSIDGVFAGFGGTRNTVTAVNLSDKKQPERKTLTSGNGKFSFTILPEGRYSLKAFDDMNGNLLQDAGKPFPWKKSERFLLYRDTIRVRARWPVDGVIFNSK